jgi:hypothetical protein
MLNRYQAIVPPGHTVLAERVLGRFFPIGGTLTLGRMNVNVASAGDLEFEIRVNGAAEATVTIDAGDLEGLEDALAVAVVGGNMVEVVLTDWPIAGLVGPASVEVAIEDGIGAGGTDEPLPIEDFVTAYYNGVLARVPDPTTELAPDVTALTSACIAATFVTQAQARIEALFDLPEFGVVTDTVFVQRVYRAYFNREPDAGGQTFWETQLAIGGAPANAANRDAMRASFATHQEFVNRSALYCRAQLPDANARSILGQNPTVFVQGVIGTAITDVDLVVYTTAALADGATEYVSLPMGGKYWKLYRIAANFSTRVQSYLRQAQRLADATRPIGTDPVGEHGCIYDFYLPPTNLDWDADPRPDGCNMDDLSSVNSWVAITNMSGATRPIQIILHRRLL